MLRVTGRDFSAPKHLVAYVFPSPLQMNWSLVTNSEWTTSRGDVCHFWAAGQLKAVWLFCLLSHSRIESYRTEAAWIPESPPRGKLLWGQYLLKVWFTDQHHQHHLKAYEKSRAEPDPRHAASESPRVGPGTLCWNRPSRWLWCTLSF